MNRFDTPQTHAGTESIGDMSRLRLLFAGLMGFVILYIGIVASYLGWFAWVSRRSVIGEPAPITRIAIPYAAVGTCAIWIFVFKKRRPR
jgi:hypothetical protein